MGRRSSLTALRATRASLTHLSQALSRSFLPYGLPPSDLCQLRDSAASAMAARHHDRRAHPALRQDHSLVRCAGRPLETCAPSCHISLSPSPSLIVPCRAMPCLPRVAQRLRQV